MYNVYHQSKYNFSPYASVILNEVLHGELNSFEQDEQISYGTMEQMLFENLPTSIFVISVSKLASLPKNIL